MPRANDRRALNRIVWRFCTGSPRLNIRERYSPSTTCYNRLVRVHETSVRDRILNAVSATYDGHLLTTNSSCVRVQQHGAGVKGDQDNGMGCTRSGLRIKIHAMVNTDGRSIWIAVTLSQVHDGTVAEKLFSSLRPGAILLADKAYDRNAIRQQAQEKDVWANIPPKSNRKGAFVFSAFLPLQKLGRALLQQA